MLRLRPHIVLRLGLIGLHLAFGALQIALLYPFSGTARRDRLKQHWSRQLLSLLGIRIELRHQGRQDGNTIDPGMNSGLLVSNHISFIDIFAINSILPSTFVSKDDVAGWPLIGWLSRHAGTLFMARGSRRAAHLAQQQMVDTLAAGKRVAVFPEGTSSDGNRVLPFHAALFQAAVEAGQPVHVFAIRYLDRDGNRSIAPAYIDDIGLLDCLVATLTAGGLRAEITLAGTLPAAGADRRTLARQAHRLVAAAIDHPAAGSVTAADHDADPSNKGAIPPEAPCAISP